MIDGGVIQIIVPNAEYWPAERLRERHRFYKYEGEGSRHYVYFTRDTLRRMLEYSGFRVLQDRILFGVSNPDSIFQNLEMTIRRTVSLFGARREIMAIAKKC